MDLSDGTQAAVRQYSPVIEQQDDSWFARPPAFVSLPSGAAQLGPDGTVTLLAKDGTSPQALTVHQDRVRDVVVSPDGSWAVTAGEGGTVVLWGIDPVSDRWSQREHLTGHDGDVVAAEVESDGRRLHTVSLDDTVISWDMSPDAGFGEPFPALPDRWISNRPQVVDPGTLLVAPTRSGASIRTDLYTVPGPGTTSVAATFLDPTSGDVDGQVVVGDTHEGALFGSSVAVSPDRSMVAVTWAHGTTVLDTHTREVVARLVPPGRTVDGRLPPDLLVWSAGWTPDGTRLLLGGESGGRGFLVPVNTTTWRPELPLIDIPGAAQVIEPSPDGTVLAVSSSNFSEMVILDAANLRLLRSVTVPDDDSVTDMSFSNDGRLLAGGGGFGLLHVWDTATWEPSRAPATVHDGGLMQAEWLADDRTIVTSGGEGTVSLFDVDRGLVRARPLRASTEPGEGFAHLVVGEDDQLVVLSGDRSGRRYSMDPSTWLEQACAIVGRDLTPTEWARYLPGRDRVPTCSDLG